MPHHRRNWFLLLSASTGLLAWLVVSPASAELRTITAIGEYRMGDNDTRTDAKRLALMDAKRLALEQVGTYLESVTEVKNLQVSHDELRAYTAGIVEVIEQTTQDVMEGAMHVVRVHVTAKIDTVVVARQIDALRKNESAKAELIRLRGNEERLQQELETKTHELATLKSMTEVEIVTQQRQQVMTKTDVRDLLARAWVALVESGESSLTPGTSTVLNRAKARNLLEQALVLAPSNPEAHLRMGVLLSEEGNHKDAVREFRTALRLQPDMAEAHTNLGVTLTLMGDVEGAITEYRTALRLKPSIAEAHDGLGIALTHKGDLKGAIAEYRVATHQRPDHAEFHQNLGDALSLIGDLEGAITEYRVALRLRPDIAETHDGLGIALGKKGDLEGAIAEYRTALRLKPNNDLVHYHLGVTLQAAGRLTEAVREFDEFLKLAPQTPANVRLIKDAQARLSELGK